MTTASDTFANFQGGLQAPLTNSFAITPSDTLELPFVTRAVYVGGTGDITLRLAGGTASQLIKAVPVGTVLPLRVRQVFATGTGATLIIGMY
jgi:hypothetical protein